MLRMCVNRRDLIGWLGDPAAALIWSKVGDGGFRHVGGELRFAPGTLADTGVYECWPRNALGRGAAARHQVRIRGNR